MATGFLSLELLRPSHSTGRTSLPAERKLEMTTPPPLTVGKKKQNKKRPREGKGTSGATQPELNQVSKLSAPK